MYIKKIGINYNGELSPEARNIVAELENPHAPPVQEMDLNQARTSNALLAYDIDCVSSGLSINDKLLKTDQGDINCRIYSPEKGTDFPLLIFAHGGCWTFCGLDSHDNICRYFAKHINCIVISVDYRLAPESPFPSGLNDYTAVIRWCLNNAQSINGDSNKIALAGDSAGGNLAAVAAQRFQGESRIRHQLLLYPICDVHSDIDSSMLKYSSGYFFTKEVLDWTSSLYTRDTCSSHEEISPINGNITSKLCSATIILSECDILCHQGLVYAKKLNLSQVPVNCYLYQGMPHAFIAMSGRLELGKNALNLCVKEVTTAFLKPS